jgi:hypothetical protein
MAEGTTRNSLIFCGCWHRPSFRTMFQIKVLLGTPPLVKDAYSQDSKLKMTMTTDKRSYYQQCLLLDRSTNYTIVPKVLITCIYPKLIIGAFLFAIRLCEYGKITSVTNSKMTSILTVLGIIHFFKDACVYKQLDFSKLQDADIFSITVIS